MSASFRALDELRKARAAVTEVLRHAPNAAPHVADALNTLDRLEKLLEAAPATATPTMRRGARNQPKAYRVEGPADREALCEYRADDPDRPFRCPKTTYDALARVMMNTSKPAKFEDIAKRLKKELGELPALYQLRVALRFWTRPEVRLVEKVRTRYHAHNANLFARDARAAWADVAR
jgi:hypothetical protein